MNCSRCNKKFTPEEAEQRQIHKIEASKELKYFFTKTQFTHICNTCETEMESLIDEANKENFPLPRSQYQEGRHYYMDNGLFVFTELFHVLKGNCCENGCRHCPYGCNS